MSSTAECDAGESELSGLRSRLVAIALEWEAAFGVAPQITSAVAELDAARSLGMSLGDYSACMQGVAAVRAGYDFVYKGVRYQVKANRPSGKPGSKVTRVPQAKNYRWDNLIWILYDRHYQVLEAFSWDVEAYKARFHDRERLSPDDYRSGVPIATASFST